MAEDDLDDILDEDEGEEDEPKKKKKGKKGKNGKKGGKLKLIIIIAVALVVVLGGTGGGLFYLGMLDSLLGIEQAKEEMEPEEDPLDLGTPVYHNIPEFVADLKTGSCRSPLVKLSLTLQVDQADQPILVEREAKIIDRIHKHLRDQERQDLMGEAGAEALRAEINLIVDATIKPAKVQNVLFKSMVLQ